MNTLVNQKILEEDRWYTVGLQPLEKVHLYSHGFDNGYSSRRGNVTEVRNLTLLALLILIIACINYINLTTARSQKRQKDVGISKTLGASTRSLISRFYIETGLITAMAIILGVVMALILLPQFNGLANRSMVASDLVSIPFMGLILGIWLVTTIIAGSYPALHLSRYSAKEMMQPTKTRSSANLVRKSLVVVQFAASVILILSVTIIYKQMKYMQDKDLGFNPNQVLAINATTALQTKKSNTLLKTFQDHPMVQSAALAQGYPGKQVSGRTLVRDANDQAGLNLQTNSTDASILDVLDLKLIAGSPLPMVKQKTDTIVEVLLNKTAVDYLGLTPQEAIGRKITAQLGNNSYVRGVVEDFNFTSLHHPISGYAFHNRPRGEYKNVLLVRFRNSDLAAVLSSFEDTFREVLPGGAFDYTFLDQQTERLYAAEKRTATLGLIFSVLAIFVACLGLFGLAAFTAEQREKEIGIRKVLGASVAAISRLLSIDFVKLVVIALLVAFPVTYYLMDSWLADFAYRITIDAIPFILTAFIALSVTLLTVSLQSIKAAFKNPINALRKE